MPAGNFVEDELSPPRLRRPRQPSPMPARIAKGFWRWRRSLVTTRRAWLFILWLSVESILVAFAASPFIPAGQSRTDIGKDLIGDLLLVGVHAPLFESLLYQFLPIVVL